MRITIGEYQGFEMSKIIKRTKYRTYGYILYAL